MQIKRQLNLNRSSFSENELKGQKQNADFAICA